MYLGQRRGIRLLEHLDGAGAPADMLGSVRCDEITHFGIDGLTKRSPTRRLLTGWSLVRIRPGEPRQIKYLAQS